MEGGFGAITIRNTNNILSAMRGRAPGAGAAHLLQKNLLPDIKLLDSSTLPNNSGGRRDVSMS
jgi:hypothetical protein